VSGIGAALAGRLDAYAKFRDDGECSGCGADFFEGDEIRPDGEGGWLAECCGEDDDG
jgi:hypothetical protein